MSADVKAEDQPQHGCEQIEAKDHSQSCVTLWRYFFILALVSRAPKPPSRQ